VFSGLLGARTFLDEEIEQWHLDVWATLIERFGAGMAVIDTPVALPTRDFFPPTEATGHAKAEHIFDCVRAVMGMPQTDWPCALFQQPMRTTGLQLSAFVHIGGEAAPGGTFCVEPDGSVAITYAPDLLDDPMGLVATLAHEMAHYLLAAEADLVEDETHELMTDLTVAYAGLGVFGANSAFSFEQHADAFSQGWRSRSSGYLSPRSWAFALAVFGELRGDDGGMGTYLKPEIEGLRRQAVKYLRKRPAILAGLRAPA
jgi:hypothetical protein